MEKSGSSTMQDTALFGTEPHQLKLGRSFDRDKHRAFHTIRYDFKPASVDAFKEGLLEVGEGHEVNITLPNVESKGTTSTKFKGSKRPLQKECVLIYDHRTGEFTLERLSCNMQVKKQREEGTSKAQQSRSLASLDASASLKNSPNLTLTSSKSKRMDLSSSTNSVLSAPDFEQGGEISPLQPSPLAPSPHTPLSHQAAYHHNDSDSSSSYITDSDSDDDDDDNAAKGSSSSSSSDGEDEGESQALRNGNMHSRHMEAGERRHVQAKPESPPRGRHLEVSQNTAQYLRSQLSQDLQLSDESDSDSD